jgi:hypothetical protein
MFVISERLFDFFLIHQKLEEKVRILELVNNKQSNLILKNWDNLGQFLKKADKILN